MPSMLMLDTRVMFGPRLRGTEQQYARCPRGDQARRTEREVFAPIFSSTKTNRFGFTLSETITLQAPLRNSSRSSSALTGVRFLTEAHSPQEPPDGGVALKALRARCALQEEVPPLGYTVAAGRSFTSSSWSSLSWWSRSPWVACRHRPSSVRAMFLAVGHPRVALYGGEADAEQASCSGLLGDTFFLLGRLSDDPNSQIF
jgi:hypothetical protein